MKKITQILLFLFLSFGWSQVDYSDSWEDYFSYNNVKDFVKTDDNIYAIVDNAIFKYTISTDEVIKISSVNGLSGETTSSIFYSKNFDKIVIGYENGLLEIIDNKGNITIAKDIVNFNYSGNKKINNITQFENNLYLSTSFAIIVYNLESLEFGDTYFIGNQSSELTINEIKIYQNTIFAATENGIYTADVLNQNLIDFNNWNQIVPGNFSTIEVLNNSIYATENSNLFKIENSSKTLVKTYPNSISKIKSSEDFLTIATQRNVYINNSNDEEIYSYTTTIANQYYFTLNVAYFETNILYLGTQEFGILKLTNLNSPLFQEIHPDGPVSNLPFSIAVKDNNLWVVYGGYSSAYAPLGKKYGFSHFNGENWINTPYNSEFGVRDLVHITFDPLVENKVYLSSWSDGMILVEEDIITTHWNHLNSGLEKLVFSNPNYISIRINGTQFDAQGNLWIANAWVDNRIKKYDTNGNWSSFDMSTVITNPALGLNELAIDKTSTIWIGSRRNGVLAFNENSGKKLALTTEQTKGSLPDLNARTVKVDNSNRIWIGTQKGLVVLYNAANVFNQNIFDAEPIIILDDGIPKKLLGDQPINSIAIDGADNKWFGTELGGAIKTNPSGLKTLNNFNKDNSPLPSNTILKIAADTNSGKVYFATNKGIVAFNSNVTNYGDELPEVYAYPNPSTKNNEFITIDGRNGLHLPNKTNIKILDTAGNLVYETNVKEGEELLGGKVTWNKTNLAGTKVASGIYIVLLTAKDATETKVTKIAIIN
jgi:ligand-binding sensor domain-containing protein